MAQQRQMWFDDKTMGTLLDKFKTGQAAALKRGLEMFSEEGYGFIPGYVSADMQRIMAVIGIAPGNTIICEKNGLKYPITSIFPAGDANRKDPLPEASVQEIDGIRIVVFDCSSMMDFENDDEKESDANNDVEGSEVGETDIR